MRKCILTLVFTFALSAIVNAQKPDQVLARVRYTYTNLDDTLNNGKIHHENMLLFIGKNASLYTSYDKLNYEITSEANFRTKAANRVGSGRPTAFIIEKAPAWISETAYHYYMKENKLFTKEVISLQNYLIEEKAPDIKWKITKDTLSFSGVFCQKAVTTYGGKDWVAWFAPSIPYQTGPWKLIALPGLIIEAYTEDKHIHFQFAGIENAKEGDHLRVDDVTKRPGTRPGDYNPLDQMIGLDVGSAYFENIIKLPWNAIKTTTKGIDRLKAAYKKDPKGFMKTLNGY